MGFESISMYEWVSTNAVISPPMCTVDECGELTDRFETVDLIRDRRSPPAINTCHKNVYVDIPTDSRYEE